MENINFKGNLTPAELEAIAKNANFSSMNGDEDEYEGEDLYEGESYEGEDLYDGADDDMVDFGGAGQSFLTKNQASGRIFTMTMENKGSASVDKVIVLNPGYSSEGRVAGAIVATDGNVIYDTSIAVGGITFGGSPKLIANF